MNPVNLFFACDDQYVPFLAVTLTSLKENRDKSREYIVRILHTGLSVDNIRRLAEGFASEHFIMDFVDITDKVESLSSQFHTRDYYSKSTYYRLFIPNLFPELDKALYLDSDLVITGDISQLYDIVLGNNLVGAIPDSMVGTIAPLRMYAQKRLRIPPERYFNAGVLLMNLKKMRECNFLDVFLRLLQSVTFQVAQDQDYLNVICRDQVQFVGTEWNTMPGAIHDENPKLIHFNLDFKPWHRDDVPFADLFWACAERSGYYDEIKAVRENYSEQDVARSAQETSNLFDLSHRQARQRTTNMLIHWRIKRVVNL